MLFNNLVNIKVFFMSLCYLLPLGLWHRIAREVWIRDVIALKKAFVLSSATRVDGCEVKDRLLAGLLMLFDHIPKLQIEVYKRSI